MVISHSSNVHISNIMVKDSPNFQMSLEDSKWVIVKQLTITADGDSPNTDGIHIQRSQNVIVYDSNIRTGDSSLIFILFFFTTRSNKMFVSPSWVRVNC